MKCKKILLLAFCFSAMVSNAVFANGHTIFVKNNTNEDIFYLIQGVKLWGTGYLVKPGAISNYRTKAADSRGVIIHSDKCKHGIGKFCSSVDSSKLGLCVSGKYIADEIYSIDIDTINHCTVTCMDKSTTSCVKTGI